MLHAQSTDAVIGFRSHSNMQIIFVTRLACGFKRVLSTFILAVFAALSMFANVAVSQELAESLEEIQPDVSPGFEDVEWFDRNFSATELNGKVVLVNFWATWCPPCVEELPSISRLWHTLDKQDFQVVAVNAGESRNDVELFLFEWDLDNQFPIVLDADLSVYKNWNVQPLPTTFVIDRTGRFRYRAIGGRNFDSENIRSIVSSLINE